MGKPVYTICKQQRRRSACASVQSDQRLCFSLPGYYNTSAYYSFKILAGLCSRAGRFVSYQVGNPKDRFSLDEAQLSSSTHPICFSTAVCHHQALTFWALLGLKLEIQVFTFSYSFVIMSAPVGLGDILFLSWSSVHLSLTKSCPLCNSKTFWDIFMKLYTNVKQHETTCRVQEP